MSSCGVTEACLWRSFRWIHGVSSFISPSVCVRMSWLFYEQDVLCQLTRLSLFCQASGSKQLSWTAPAPHILRLSVTILLYLAFFFYCGFCQLASQQSHQFSLWTKTSLDSSEVVCVSSERGHQKSGESDSWSSSWSGPLIRSEWPENMGPNRYLPPAPAPSLLLPYGQ